MTNEQKALVLDSYNLIYWYAKKNNLDLEEYEDILAYALCKAANSFDPQRTTKFSTLAITCMRNEHYMHVRKESKHKRCLSYNSVFPLVQGNDEELTEYVETIIGDRSIYDRINMLDFSVFDEVTQKVLNYKICGYTQAEISKILGYSQSWISRILRNCEKELRVQAISIQEGI